MIPILFESTETSFASNGLGRLSDVISCKVVEKRNGSYELEMKYPVKGIHFTDLIEDRIIFAKPFDGGNNQAFRIYSIQKSLDGNAVVYGEHISYLLNQTTVMPFTASSCSEAIARLPNYITTQNYFTFWTDKDVVGNFEITEPRQVRGVLGGESGSLLDVYGKAEYEFDNFTVKMWLNRGSDNGVTLRYGKNITELTNTGDDQSAYTGIVPFWKGTDEDGETEIIKTLNTPVVWSTHQGDFAYPRVVPVDFSQEWQEEPTDEQLRARAESYINNNSGWAKKQELDISFVALWQTEEYKNVAQLERVKLCDKVTVIYPDLGITDKLQVIETDYNVLLERYNSIKLGESRTSLVSEVVSTDSKITNLASSIEGTKTSFMKALDHATELLTGGLGGHVVIGTDANGKPNEIYIMNTDDVETATQVLRMNMNGIGFSNNGVNGPYASAWTIDGHFVADFIDTGTLSANIMKAGTIQARNGDDYWNLETGVFHLSSQTAQEVAQYVDAAGLILYMPYTITGTTVNFQARVLKGEEDVTYNYPGGSFMWYKKDDFVITELGSGYTLRFDLRDFEYGGSIILRLEKMDYFYLKDDAGNILLDHDGNALMVTAQSTSYDYVRLIDSNGDVLTDLAGNELTGYMEVPWISVETDFTNGAAVSELSRTSEELVSRFDHYNGTNKTIETVISQKASSIQMAISGTAGKEATGGASITLTMLDENGEQTGDPVTGVIYIDGQTVFTNELATAGSTVINGGNITTGTIQSDTGKLSLNLDDDTLRIEGATVVNGSITGTSISQTVNRSDSHATGGGYSPTIITQASIANGIGKFGGIDINDVNIVGEGNDDAGGYKGVLVKGHLSTYGCVWAGQGSSDSWRLNCRGWIWTRGIVFEDNSQITSSDRRLKHEIHDLDTDRAIRFVLGLKPVSFEYISDTNNRVHHGFIAQDVEEILEDDWSVVTEYREPDDPSTIRKGLSYTEIIADLVATVQSLNQRVKALEDYVQILQS